MVAKQLSVDKSTQFAASSVSEPCISAIFKITEAHGVAERIRTLALSEKSSGRKYTHKKPNNGKTNSFKRQAA